MISRTDDCGLLARLRHYTSETRPLASRLIGVNGVRRRTMLYLAFMLALLAEQGCTALHVIGRDSVTTYTSSNPFYIEITFLMIRDTRF